MLKKISSTKNNDSLIDIVLLLKNWWYFKKLVIFGTLIATLLALFIIILFNNAPKKQSSKYISAVVQGDLLGNNDRVVVGLKSPEILKNTLKTLGFDLSVYNVLQSMVIQKATNPLAENLQDYIVNLKVSDIQRLAISDQVLTSVMQKLKNTSDNLISIQFRYKPLNLTELQAKNLIYLLVKDVNNNILLNTNRQDLGVKLINIDDYVIESFTETEKLSRLFNISNSVKDNLLILSSEYSGILIGSDLSGLTNISNNAQKLLFQISKKKGNTSSMDNLKLEIAEVDRNLYDLSNTLSYIDTRKNQPSDIEYSLSNPDQNPSFQINNQFFDKILSFGNLISLSEFRKETLIEQSKLQKLKNNLLTQIDSLQLPFEYDENLLTLSIVEKRIYSVAAKVNLAINQVRSIANPEQVIEFVQNPESVDISSGTNMNLIKTVIILSIISFICLSSVAFLLNPKSSRRT